ncbi:uncharacterized protein TRUGW13939_10868 [Talaromyces rugulosus]|uniref:Major facilitator superfamily (MFS) profile domain-containing protein n=1 Tax=Talaromyces rugulosus TaxID=121627 RepID=A0A7H8RC91_TALRU|nr:uncharacterized protein TRUGW13939_10868 [Talaromyces rugulosus]QKX63697.1 hypothetical protein TRUGW13939_10868 [Talaromyces rugulosus]
MTALADSSDEPTLILKNDTHGAQEMARAIVVKLEGPNDLSDSRNWPTWKRVFCSENVGIIALVIGDAGAIDSSAIPQAATEFKVSHVVEALATGLFLCGIGAGALIPGPLSETVGRNPVYFASLILFMFFFIFGAGISQSIEAQLVCRFFAGFCGESPLSTIGGSVGDLWGPFDRLIAFPIFADNYGLSQGITGLLFLGIEIGTLLASVILTPFAYQKAKKYLVTLKAAGLETTATNRLKPEFFLWYSILGAPAIPISLFWMGWTATPNISMWSPITASVLLGWGNPSIFVSAWLYMIDTYETYAASALTINLFVQYTTSGAMLQASIPMYENMRVG